MNYMQKWYEQKIKHLDNIWVDGKILNFEGIKGNKFETFKRLKKCINFYNFFPKAKK